MVLLLPAHKYLNTHILHFTHCSCNVLKYIYCLVNVKFFMKHNHWSISVLYVVADSSGGKRIDLIR